MTRSLLGATTLFLAACFPQFRPPAEVVVSCGAGADCPNGWSCSDGVCRPREKPCLDDSECGDGSFCSGAERCVEGFCVAGPPPCSASFACVRSTCDEAAGRCLVTVAHDVCAAGDYCDPAGGCIPGARCMPERGDDDCQDGFLCNGRERCIGFHCVAGSPPAQNTGNPCIIAACAESEGVLAIAAPDGSACALSGVARAVCLSGACGASQCGDGYVDSVKGERCDDGDQDSCAGKCNADCSGPANTCGDGVVACGEICDDGNASGGDGCTPDCHVQPGWTCDASTPSRCALARMVRLDAGTFVMGSPSGELGREVGEVQHGVTLSRAFAISPTEITQNEFLTTMGWQPAAFSCPTCPVESVSWFDVAAYANQVTLDEGGTPCYVLASIKCANADNEPTPLACMNNAKGGIALADVSLNGVTSVYDCTGFRLPTEAEWEYAARAGDARATYNGNLDSGHLLSEQPNPVLDGIGWFLGNSGAATHVKASLAPNAWGLYDTLGNVWEWCHDESAALLSAPVTDPEGTIGSGQRVFRGGNWAGEAQLTRAATRRAAAPGTRGNGTGGRLVRTTP